MAWDINKVIIVGRLTSDPEFSYTSNNQTPLCKFSVANNQGKESKDVSFFDIVTWNKTAENCAQYLKKGSQIVIEGKVSQQRWTTQEGQTRSRVEIVAHQVQFVGKRNEEPTQEKSQGNAIGFGPDLAGNVFLDDDPVSL